MFTTLLLSGDGTATGLVTAPRLLPSMVSAGTEYVEPLLRLPAELSLTVHRFGSSSSPGPSLPLDRVLPLASRSWFARTSTPLTVPTVLAPSLVSLEPLRKARLLARTLWTNNYCQLEGKCRQATKFAFRTVDPSIQLTKRDLA